MAFPPDRAGGSAPLTFRSARPARVPSRTRPPTPQYAACPGAPLRSRLTSCCGPTVTACSPWPRPAAASVSTGWTPSAAASCRWTASICRAGSPAPCCRTPSPSRWTATSPAPSPAARIPPPAATIPGSTRRSSACSANCTISAMPTRWKPARTAIWSAASTAWRSAACSSARACSASRAMPPRWRWCTLSRGCVWAASGCWTRSSSPRTCPSSAPRNWRGTTTRRGWLMRSPCRPASSPNRTRADLAAEIRRLADR